MRPNSFIQCLDFPCRDTRRESYAIPDIEIDPAKVSIVLISEASPANPADGYYAGPGALFAQTTVLAFQDAGAQVASIAEILALGVYLTTAVKCGKTGYAIDPESITNCSRLLEQELALFPNVQAYLLMGDVVIRALNTIARRAGEPRVIPSGSTYKLRAQEYYFRGKRAFPSYLQAGPSFFIEKSKRRMIAEDLAAALKYVP
ncbi:MAG: uracil-DNA glycosylase [Chloroflexi bacterium]|nr:uracil-DNA glycosylase [Chloroflexota bacterium]